MDAAAVKELLDKRMAEQAKVFQEQIRNERDAREAQLRDERDAREVMQRELTSLGAFTMALIEPIAMQSWATLCSSNVKFGESTASAGHWYGRTLN